MINLNDYEDFWRTTVETCVPEVRGIYFVTVETDIQSVIKNITRQGQPFLVVVTPSAASSGSADAFAEINNCLIYLYSKEDRSSTTIDKTFGIQKDLQPVLEKIKTCIRNNAESACGLMQGLDYESMQTDPERLMFSELSGWSMSFSFESK